MTYSAFPFSATSINFLQLNLQVPTFPQHNTHYTLDHIVKEGKSKWPQNVNLPIEERVRAIISDGSHVWGHGWRVDSSLNCGQTLSFHGELSTESSFLQNMTGRGRTRVIHSLQQGQHSIFQMKNSHQNKAFYVYSQ